MPPRLVADTNVILSGLVFGGTPGRLLELVREGEVLLVTSAPLQSELERVLQRKFPDLPDTTCELQALLRKLALLAIPQEVVTIISADPSDNRVLECALAGKADAIVSGDRHLLALKTFRHIPILTPHAFLETFRR